MFHIKNDPRSNKTAAVLGKALLRVLQTTPINEITVSSLSRETGIARSTFYRLFDTPEDILHYLCSEYAKQLTEYFEQHNFSDIRDLSIASITLSFQNYELLDALVRNHRLDLLIEMYAENFKHITNRVPVLQELEDSSSEYIHSFLYMTMSAVQTTWLKRGMKETPEQLFSYLKEYQNVLSELLDSE